MVVEGEGGCVVGAVVGAVVEDGGGGVEVLGGGKEVVSPQSARFTPLCKDQNQIYM